MPVLGVVEPCVEVRDPVGPWVLAARDVKGLYRKAMAGELPHFTGVSDPYEPPEHPEVTVRTDQEAVEVSVERVLGALRERRLIR